MCGLLCSLILASSATADNILKLEAAARGTHRSVDNVARNTARHPVETLQFFGIKDNLTVVEIWPGGGGWYTEVLAVYLRENGKLTSASKLNYWQREKRRKFTAVKNQKMRNGSDTRKWKRRRP